MPQNSIPQNFMSLSSMLQNSINLPLSPSHTTSRKYRPLHSNTPPSTGISCDNNLSSTHCWKRQILHSPSMQDILPFFVITATARLLCIMKLFASPVVGIVSLYLTLPTTVVKKTMVCDASMVNMLGNEEILGGGEIRRRVLSLNSQQDIRAQKALKRTLKEAFIFDNTYQADLMEQLNKKGKAKEPSQQSQPQPQIEKIKEDDGLYIEGMTSSVGAHVKKSALSLYNNYYEDNNAKPTITLGLNSILDLSYDFPDSQSILFASNQWHDLRRMLKLNKDTKQVVISTKLQLMLDKAEIMAKTDLSSASDFVFKNLYKYKARLSQDEAYVLLHLVKFWGPLMEKLIQKTGLRLKWGESSCSFIPSRLRADVRIIYDKQEGNMNKEYDMMDIEASRISPSRQKFDFDHTKLLVKTKDIIDSLEDNVDKELCCIQFCGLEKV
ncbi:uncharacterized protein EV154DRAFT_574703 [Mucor mucedo]|uniref:uncharacterized protein n=1 Tax=Mucor mucedo TaxID=29922 RepID=UPI00221FCB32|nr:uncharacterized protein EV154DRAFT_574703 [Mucor mucedo]KAI7884124.1 hypothetical protein EV154DRAFT_574703 [Mucor mucedo]